MEYCSVFIYPDGDNAAYLHETREQALAEIKGAFASMMDSYPMPRYNCFISTVSENEWHLHIEDQEEDTDTIAIGAVANVYSDTVSDAHDADETTVPQQSQETPESAPRTKVPLCMDEFVMQYDYPDRLNVLAVKVEDGDVRVGGMICSDGSETGDPFIYLATKDDCRLNYFIDGDKTERSLREYLDWFTGTCLPFYQEAPDLESRLLMRLRDLFDERAMSGVILRESELSDLYRLENGTYLVGVL